jgi:formate--tetrahydrofolate ligase
VRPLPEIAEAVGLRFDDLEPYGRDKAKIPLELFPKNGTPGKLIVVTAITPTPAGEGKTTTTLGLTDGLNAIGRRAIATIRQPSLGPLFGRKGGGTGGGRATAEPATDINLHFTGDFHAIESAHNFLAAMADNTAHNAMLDGFSPTNITWRRVTDAEDRALRHVVTGIGGRTDGPLRETGYDISAASEIMAIIALAKDYEDLRQRIGDIVVGWTNDRKPVTARDVQAVGSMMVLLKDALKPNLVQTQDGNPVVAHAGPFGNIAHGCSSIVADDFALPSTEFVCTEAGFGADLGFEKFMDIKVRQGGAKPSAAVVVTTIRGLKWHGGKDLKDMASEDVEAVEKGSSNLKHAIGIARRYGLPVVVAINRYPDDHPAEIEAAQRAAAEAGARAAVEAKGFAEGGEGMRELAAAAAEAAESGEADVKLLYEDDERITEKVEKLAKHLYLAGSVTWGPMTRTTASRFEENGWDFPICIAKTNLSISANPRLRGAPEGHVFPVQELRIAAGSRQIITLAGDIMTLPGLPVDPNAFEIDLTPEGEVVGLL